MKKLFFIIGSQDLYGDETLKQAERNGREIAEFINDKTDLATFENQLEMLENLYAKR